MAETSPIFGISSAARRASRSGKSAPVRANSLTLGFIAVATLTSRKGVSPRPLTTCIISAGVTPLAVIAATNEPALVPT